MAEEPLPGAFEAVIADEGHRSLRYRFHDGEVFDLQGARLSWDDGPVVIATVVEVIHAPVRSRRVHKSGNAIQFVPSHLHQVIDTSSNPPLVLWSS